MELMCYIELEDECNSLTKLEHELVIVFEFLNQSRHGCTLNESLLCLRN